MIQNLGYAIRMLRKSPGFTVVAVCSLAIGIGANSAIFSLADAILLRPLPVLHASEVVSVNMHSPSDPASDVSYRDYVDFRDKIHSFHGLIAFNQTRLAYRQRPDAMTQMKVGFLVSGNLFRDMGVEPTLGRGFREDEDRVPGRDAVVVLSHDFWLKEFSGDASVIGREISLNGASLPSWASHRSTLPDWINTFGRRCSCHWQCPEPWDMRICSRSAETGSSPSGAG